MNELEILKEKIKRLEEDRKIWVTVYEKEIEIRE